jgi:hypothetical protein
MYPVGTADNHDACGGDSFELKQHAALEAPYGDRLVLAVLVQRFMDSDKRGMALQDGWRDIRFHRQYSRFPHDPDLSDHLFDVIEGDRPSVSISDHQET